VIERMSRIKSQLRFGLWPETGETAPHHAGLTLAARRLAEATVAELGRLGVVVTLEGGRARFRAKVLPSAARRLIETHGDLVEAFLHERASL
jgi:hypothetical protein